jgi:hypothetical protein
VIFIFGREPKAGKLLAANESAVVEQDLRKVLRFIKRVLLEDSGFVMKKDSSG